MHFLLDAPGAPLLYPQRDREAHAPKPPDAASSRRGSLEAAPVKVQWYAASASAADASIELHMQSANNTSIQKAAVGGDAPPVTYGLSLGDLLAQGGLNDVITTDKGSMKAGWVIIYLLSQLGKAIKSQQPVLDICNITESTILFNLPPPTGDQHPTWNKNDLLPRSLDIDTLTVRLHPQNSFHERPDTYPADEPRRFPCWDIIRQRDPTLSTIEDAPALAMLMYRIASRWETTEIDPPGELRDLANMFRPSTVLQCHPYMGVLREQNVTCFRYVMMNLHDPRYLFHKTCSPEAQIEVFDVAADIALNATDKLESSKQVEWVLSYKEMMTPLRAICAAPHVYCLAEPYGGDLHGLSSLWNETGLKTSIDSAIQMQYEAFHVRDKDGTPHRLQIMHGVNEFAVAVLLGSGAAATGDVTVVEGGSGRRITLDGRAAPLQVVIKGPLRRSLEPSRYGPALLPDDRQQQVVNEELFLNETQAYEALWSSRKIGGLADDKGNLRETWPRVPRFYKMTGDRRTPVLDDFLVIPVFDGTSIYDIQRHTDLNERMQQPPREGQAEGVSLTVGVYLLLLLTQVAITLKADPANTWHHCQLHPDNVLLPRLSAQELEERQRSNQPTFYAKTRKHDNIPQAFSGSLSVKETMRLGLSTIFKDDPTESYTAFPCIEHRGVHPNVFIGDDAAHVCASILKMTDTMWHQHPANIDAARQLCVDREKSCLAVAVDVFNGTRPDVLPAEQVQTAIEAYGKKHAQRQEGPLPCSRAGQLALLQSIRDALSLML
ncbi:unnamed protein product [Vitrella brassicaformis CCMP3155]|uniref:Uncharacterized protein n=2 Tax=Vitrella brassicaformis TaxID=1169539 RepID=A0A0G4GLK1_VITBC|nr:unnamed protein product [Vitrella brassicaformis CCMP3155]|eukprot:CEM30995.1 unnamed protein product [Vitrella brassicaformis CCMP3155]